MKLPDFANIFAPLAIQLRQTDADEATIRAYFLALQDLEPEFVAMAATRLAVSAEWFPKTSEWRAMAVKIERERTDEQRALLRRLPAPLCAACDDTAWARGADGRVHRCACFTLRRLELLGRRPWPALPEAGHVPDDVLDVVEAKSLTTMIERRTGTRMAPRAMADARDADRE